MSNIIKKRSEESIRFVLNKNFTFSDLSKRFINVDSTTGNIFCPFHENHETPSAKMYWNEYRQIWVIYCFGQCHRHFTAYDYVKLILCDKYQKYQSPLDFLLHKMDKNELYVQLDLFDKEYEEQEEYNMNEKIEYIFFFVFTVVLIFCCRI